MQPIIRSVSQKWISQNSTKGDPLGRLAVESLRGGGGRASAPPPLALNPLLSMVIFSYEHFKFQNGTIIMKFQNWTIILFKLRSDLNLMLFWHRCLLQRFFFCHRSSSGSHWERVEEWTPPQGFDPFPPKTPLLLYYNNLKRPKLKQG